MSEKQETIRIDVTLKGDLAQKFKAVKKAMGPKWNASVVKALIADKFREQKNRIVYCPNGCLTPLIRKRFAKVFNKSKAGESLYCPRCHTRWIPEKHSDILNLLEKPSQVR
jgi:hypothetical protein